MHPNVKHGQTHVRGSLKHRVANFLFKTVLLQSHMINLIIIQLLFTFLFDYSCISLTILRLNLLVYLSVVMCQHLTCIIHRWWVDGCQCHFLIQVSFSLLIVR